MAPGICVYREVGNRCSQKWTSQRNFRFFWKAWRLANRNVAAGGGRLKLTFPATTLARKRTQSIGRVKSSVLVIFGEGFGTGKNCVREATAYDLVRFLAPSSYLYRDLSFLSVSYCPFAPFY